MTKQVIEFTCTGNHGRSEPCRIISQYELRLRGLDQKLEAASSGTLVDVIANGTAPISDNIACIQLALDRGDVYTPEQAGILYSAMIENDDGPINELYSICRNVFDREEEEWREEWLLEFNKRHGTVECIKGTRDQTRPNPNVVALFTMTQSNQKAATEIYRLSGYDPLIEVLPVFVTGKRDSSVVNAFGTSNERYQAMAAQLEELVPRAIDLLLR